MIQGTLLVIPIEESLLYIRPLYLRAAGGRIPELKRVIVAYQNQIVMDATLDDALGAALPEGRRRPRRIAAPVEGARRQAGDAAGAAHAPTSRRSRHRRERPTTAR